MFKNLSEETLMDTTGGHNGIKDEQNYFSPSPLAFIGGLAYGTHVGEEIAERLNNDDDNRRRRH